MRVWPLCRSHRAPSCLLFSFTSAILAHGRIANRNVLVEPSDQLLCLKCSLERLDHTQMHAYCFLVWNSSDLVKNFDESSQHVATIIVFLNFSSGFVSFHLISCTSLLLYTHIPYYYYLFYLFILSHPVLVIGQPLPHPQRFSTSRLSNLPDDCSLPMLLYPLRRASTLPAICSLLM